jgi:hypothetical protein
VTFEELDQKFPNGFDDAEITSLRSDYRIRTATLELNLRGNPPDNPNSQEYRPAVLTVHEFYYFSIEPPDPEHLFYPDRSKITVDGLPEDANFPLFAHLKQTIPDGAFCCRFYVHDWNSFIHIAAKDARFSWVTDEEAEKSDRANSPS